VSFRNFTALAPRGLENWWPIYSLKDDEVRSRLGTLLADFQTCSAPTVPKLGLTVSLGASELLFWIFRFIIAEALKTTTRRGGIGASTPVFGFRPMRWPFSRTVKDPNDESFTVSHRATVSMISFNTRSTKADDSVRVNPIFVP
jgi:hypothetical protein